jgi:hypothetical protein
MFQPISVEDAGRSIRQELVGAADCDRLAMDCALLRSCVWALSEGKHPVHSLRLLNLAMEVCPDAVLGIDDAGSELRARLRSSLEELADAGDVVALANGRWLPAPTREVHLGTKDNARLLVGGLPTSLLPQELTAIVRHHGPFRRTNGDRLAKALSLLSETLDSWVGVCPSDLEAWTQAALEGEYEGFTEANDGREFILYAPQSARPGVPQVRRWVQSKERLSGRFLGQRDLPFGMRQYRAVEVVNGKIVRLASLRLGTGELRRLRYGLDAIARNPVLVEHETRGTELVVVLRSEVPRPERRFFAALGQLSVPSDKYYPRTWRFPLEYSAEILKRLTALNVRLANRSGETQA